MKCIFLNVMVLHTTKTKIKLHFPNLVFILYPLSSKSTNGSTSCPTQILGKPLCSSWAKNAKAFRTWRQCSGTVSAPLPHCCRKSSTSTPRSIPLRSPRTSQIACAMPWRCSNASPRIPKRARYSCKHKFHCSSIRSSIPHRKRDRSSICGWPVSVWLVHWWKWVYCYYQQYAHIMFLHFILNI